MTTNIQIEGALRDLASRRLGWFLVGIIVGWIMMLVR